MKLGLHLYDNYKKFLNDALTQRGRGSQTLLAEKIRCTKGYLSQVLKGSRHLSTEQGLRAAQFMALDREGTRFFLLLIQHQSADTHELKAFYKNEIDSYQKKKSGTTAFDQEHESRLARKHRSEYYSAWRYTAIRMALKIPGLHTETQIAQYLGLSKKETQRILGRLVVMGLVSQLVSQSKTHYSLNHDKSLLLDEDPLAIEAAHRAHSIYLSDAQARGQRTGNYFSSFYALSDEDTNKIAAILSKATTQIHQLGIASKKPKHLYYLGMGFARATLED